MPQPRVINANSDNPLDRVTSQERLFVEGYLRLFNAELAAQAAGYKNPKDATRLKARPRVREAITYLFETHLSEKYKDKLMTREEMSQRLSEMARTDLSDFLKEGEAVAGKKVLLGEVDLDKAKLSGKFWLVKGLKQTEWGLEVSFHSVQAAMKQLAELRGYLAPTKVEQTNKQEYDFSKLTPTEFSQLRGLLLKAAVVDSDNVKAYERQT